MKIDKAYEEKNYDMNDNPYSDNLIDLLKHSERKYFDDLLEAESNVNYLAGPTLCTQGRLAGGCLGLFVGLLSGAIGGYFVGNNISDYFDISNKIARIGIDTGATVMSAVGSGSVLGFFGQYILSPIILSYRVKNERKENKNENR